MEVYVLDPSLEVIVTGIPDYDDDMAGAVEAMRGLIFGQPERGSLEHVRVFLPTRPGWASMFVDEEGALREDRQLNLWASLLYQQASMYRGAGLLDTEAAVIYGRAVLTMKEAP